MTLTTKISEAGSVDIPESVREAIGWRIGTELELITRGTEIVLRSRSNDDERFPPVSVEEFLAMVPKVSGPPITDEEIERIVLKEAGRRFD